MASKGVDETILTDGDQIGWNYIVYNAAVHGTTRYAAIKQQASGNT